MTRLRHRLRAACAAVLAGGLVCFVPACTHSGTSTPEGAAHDFLSAVADGRAADALGFLRLAPADDRLLTDTVLTEAVSRAPVTRIVAARRGGGDARHATVDVSYQVDGLPVTDTYQMFRAGGQWFVDEPLPTVPEYSDHPGGVRVTVDGVAADSGREYQTPVLPGRYRLGLDHPMLTVASAEFTVLSLHGPAVRTGGGPRTHLTPEASQQVATAAADMLTACLAATTSRTPCGFSTSDATEPVAWSLVPGSTDLDATRPDWDRCGLYRDEIGVCVDSIYVTASHGHDHPYAQVQTGYLADISDPDQIRVVFLRL